MKTHTALIRQGISDIELISYIFRKRDLCKLPHDKLIDITNKLQDIYFDLLKYEI